MDARLDEPIGRLYRQYNRRPHGGPDDLVRHPEWTGRILDRLGRPEDHFPVIMVTGSKGKGSTAFYLARILEAHGLSVGFFSTPHLVDNLERLRLDGRAVSPARFVQLFRTLEPVLDAVERELPAGHYIGPVGLFAALAALWYREEGVDAAVFETGRGARFDDVAELHHVGAVITSVLLEHREELGPTLDRVAWHKAGIVRRETGWAVVVDDARLGGVLAREAAGRDIQLEHAWPLSDIRVTPAGTEFTTRTGGSAERFRVPALALFAAENARRALVAAHRFLGPRFSMERARAGLVTARLYGRADLLEGRPPMLVDGSIHRFSVRSLLQGLSSARLLRGRIVSIVGVPADKDWTGVAAQVSPLGDLFFAPAENRRLHFPVDPHLAFPQSRSFPNFQEAYRAALEETPDIILVLGTQSLVADTARVLDLAPTLLDLAAPPTPVPT